MKKRFVTMAVASLLSLTMSIPAFAGQWLSDANGWWYQNDDGTYPANTWQWIDGNNDGVAECYYFNEQGYCLMNTTTPDGYTVNPSGAWIIDGVVQTQAAAANPAPVQAQKTVVKETNLLDLTPVSHGGFYNTTNQRTNQNAVWSNCFVFGTTGNDYVEYYTGKEYSTLTFTYAPAENYKYDDQKYDIEVYGDNDTLLDSFRVDYKTTPQTVTVDVSGNDYIRIYYHNLHIGSWAAYALIKDAVLRVLQ